MRRVYTFQHLIYFIVVDLLFEIDVKQGMTWIPFRPVMKIPRCKHI